MRYRLICFDAGFTLIAPRRTIAATLADILASEGVAPTDEALQRAWNIADQWFWQEYHRPDNDTWSSDERIYQTWRHYHTLMLRDLGIDDPQHRIVDTVLTAYGEIENWQVYSDVLPMLASLRPQAGQPGDGGLPKMGIVSDWGSRLPHIVSGLGIGHYFDFVLASADVGAAKPSARFYRMALDAAGVAPHEALMIGDSYHADVLGARSAGMSAVLLDRQGAADAVDAPVIRSLADVPAIVGE